MSEAKTILPNDNNLIKDNIHKIQTKHINPQKTTTNLLSKVLPSSGFKLPDKRPDYIKNKFKRFRTKSLDKPVSNYNKDLKFAFYPRSPTSPKGTSKNTIRKNGTFSKRINPPDVGLSIYSSGRLTHNKSTSTIQMKSYINIAFDFGI